MSVLGWLQLVSVFVRPRLGSWGRRWPLARAERDDTGASLVEYALLVALIAVVCIIAITFLGRNASEKLSDVSSSIGS